MGRQANYNLQEDFLPDNSLFSCPLHQLPILQFQPMKNILF